MNIRKRSTPVAAKIGEIQSESAGQRIVGWALPTMFGIAALFRCAMRTWARPTDEFR